MMRSTAQDRESETPSRLVGWADRGDGGHVKLPIDGH